MNTDKAKNLTAGTFIRVNLRGALDGIKYLSNGPLVLADGDIAEITGGGVFPGATPQGLTNSHKYVATFHGMGGLRMLLGAEEIAAAFDLLDRTGSTSGGPHD